MPVEKTRSAITRNKHWESIFEMAAQQSYVVVGGEALTFGYESFSDLPGENGRILAFVLLDFGDDGRRGHFRFGAADDSRRTGSHDAAVTRRSRGGRCGGQQFRHGRRREAAGCGASYGGRRMMMLVMVLMGGGCGGGCEELLMMSGQIVSRADQPGRVTWQVNEPLVMSGRGCAHSRRQTRRRRSVQVP